MWVFIQRGLTLFGPRCILCSLYCCSTWMKGAFVLVVLLGLTWMFGLFYIDSQSVFMAYIFTLLNSLQGLFIFVFHCLMSDKVSVMCLIYTPCPRKDAPALASYSFDKHWLILIILGKRNQHTFKNDERIQFSLSVYFYLLLYIVCF